MTLWLELQPVSFQRTQFSPTHITEFLCVKSQGAVMFLNIYNPIRFSISFLFLLVEVMV